MEPTDNEITEAMICYGGSFVSALGQLWRKADATNRAKLHAAFWEYWAEYRELVRLKARA